MSKKSVSPKNLQKQVKRRLTRSKKRLVRNSLIVTNAVLLLFVAGFVISTRSSQLSQPEGPALFTTSDENVADPLDTLSSADIAVSIAQLVQLDEATAVTNNADSINTQFEIVPADAQIVAKPQIVTTDVLSASDVETYVAVDGDTISSIAEKFGVSQNSIRWSNDLSGSNVAAGTELSIPPLDGFIYDVEDGDTVEKLAERYSAEADRITAFNDIELVGLVAGQQIVIPDGSIPAPARPVAFGAASGFRFGSSAVYGYNGYDRGYCTWYTANRRAEVGKPIPANLGNASTWKSRAQLAGIPVSNTPQKYAVIWTPPRDYYGHVGFVEEVYPDGSVRISEMNVRGWNVRSEKVLTPAQAAGYSYIY